MHLPVSKATTHACCQIQITPSLG
uniref:Uncharacterized protein n=1 Tax=Arundo donax TaxID=35708 RepID=A0A0A8YVQ0_ARUDO